MPAADTSLMPPALANADDLQRLRLGVLTGTPAYRDEAGRVWVNHSIARLLEAFRERMPRTRVCIPITPAKESGQNHILQIPNEAIVDLPPLVSTLRAQRYARRTRQIVQRFAAEVDLLFIRLPFQLPQALRGLTTPKLLHVVGNTRKVIDASTAYRPLMKKVAQWFASRTDAATQRLAAEPRTRIVTNGREMWDQLACRRGRVVVSSCLTRDEMQPRRDTALRNPPRLLFVGYIRPEKGCLQLLDAFEQLRRTRPLKLTLAGGSSRPSALEQAILDRVRASPFRDDIELPGIIPFGPPLFDLYRDHDIYILPTFSEGTPRTLVEARAFGCPVIATNVGGIPSSVEDGRDGLLIPPNDVGAIARAVQRMLDDEPLRQRLIAAGLDRSRAMTLEQFADDLVEELRLLAADAGLLPTDDNSTKGPV
jgi:glycosyltransferase involved in cell wall biosynthesis